jgi:hypothetical protein
MTIKSFLKIYSLISKSFSKLSTPTKLVKTPAKTKSGCLRLSSKMICRVIRNRNWLPKKTGTDLAPIIRTTSTLLTMPTISCSTISTWRGLEGKSNNWMLGQVVGNNPRLRIQLPKSNSNFLIVIHIDQMY